MKPSSLQMFIVISLLSGLFGTMTGCGSGKSGGGVVVSSKSSKICIECHANNSKSISPTSGVRITGEWQLSAHNTAHGAGCLDCHSNAHYHDNNVTCISCHATAHTNKGSICSDCHGGNSPNLGDCRTCHANVHQGVDSCNRCHSGAIPVDVALKNPDFAGKCFGCHKDAKNFKNYSTAPRHFNNFTGAGVHPAKYVTINYQNFCTSCHEPHNPLLGLGKEERKAWAKSGHGNVYGKAFANRDFKSYLDSTSNSYACIRCHTSTGYSNYLANNWTTPFPSTTWATAGDNGREVLTCSTCHINSSFKVKSAPAYIAPYNKNLSPKRFPDVGESNLCLACHSGRENADTIEAITDFTNVSFKNSHYKAGAALMYMASGFDNFTTPTTKFGTGYTTATTYQKTMTPDNVSVPSYGISGGVTSTHRKLGTTMINGDSHNAAFFVPGTADANGPCVTCHLNVNGVPDRPATGHSWKIDANAFNQLCVKCHADEGGVPLTGDNFQTLFLEEQAAGFKEALGLITNQFTKYSISYDPHSHPYFYDELLPLKDGKKQQVKDWTRGTNDQKFGKRLMGAAFNLNLLTRDQGSYVHARTFVRRLIYDTVDYLDNNKMDFSVSETATAYNSTLYSRGTKAYNINSGVTKNGITTYSITTLYTGTSADMAYLLGYNRSGATGGTANLSDAQAQEKAGSWNTPDRP